MYVDEVCILYLCTFYESMLLWYSGRCLPLHLLPFPCRCIHACLPPHARLLVHTHLSTTTSYVLRHVHIGLDTLVLYSALGVTTRPGHNNNNTPNDRGAPAKKKAKGESSYHSGEFHHNHHHHGPEPSPLRVTADEGGRDGPNAMTSSSSPDYIPEDDVC